MCATLIVTLLKNDVGVQIHALTPIGKYATIQIVGPLGTPSITDADLLWI